MLLRFPDFLQSNFHKTWKLMRGAYSEKSCQISDKSPYQAMSNPPGARGTGGLGSPLNSGDDDPALEPVNGQCFPPFLPRPDRPGRLTNQLKYLR